MDFLTSENLKKKSNGEVYTLFIVVRVVALISNKKNCLIMFEKVNKLKCKLGKFKYLFSPLLAKLTTLIVLEFKLLCLLI